MSLASRTPVLFCPSAPPCARSQRRRKHHSSNRRHAFHGQPSPVNVRGGAGGGRVWLKGGGQSDKIWRIDLEDDRESCHPVGLRSSCGSS